MGRVSRARRIATAAAYGGGGISLLGVAATGLIISQIMAARRAIKPLDIGPQPCDGTYGDHHPGPNTTLALLGDSSAVGLGVTLSRETPGALLGSGLADISGHPVQVRSFAEVGARSADLPPQVAAAREIRPDVAVILIGGNDVINRVWPSVAVHHLEGAVRTLVDAGITVVVGTCPDLGTVAPIRPPLRWVARRWSRELAAAQTIAVVEAGARTVSLGDLLGPEFITNRGKFFSPDLFHPSAAGYAAVASVMLPTLAVALGMMAEREAPAAAPDRAGDVRSLPHAAVAAADRAGTEVSGAELAGRERGPWGRWAELRRRVLGHTDHPDERDTRREIPDSGTVSQQAGSDPEAGPQSVPVGSEEDR